MFTLAIPCLTTSNLPGFMNLTSRFTWNIFLYNIRLYFSPSNTITIRCCFCFGSGSSLFLQLFLCSSLILYWTPTDLGGSYFSVISFCIFILFMEFSSKNTEVVCHSLPMWTMFCQALISRDMSFSFSAQLDDIPNSLAVPLLVLAGHINLH